jgi:hypothetical protein
MTPNFAVVGIDTSDFHMPRLWLPVFLLWIPVILLSPLIFLVLAVIAIFSRITIWRIISICWGVLSGLPGTHVHISTCDARILVRIL